MAEKRLQAVGRGAFKSAHFLVKKMRLKSLEALTGRIRALTLPSPGLMPQPQASCPPQHLRPVPTSTRMAPDETSHEMQIWLRHLLAPSSPMTLA